MVDTIRDTDVGTQFKVTVQEISETDSIAVKDISTFTTLNIEFLEPNGTTVVIKTATFFTDGSDGIIQFTTVDTSVFLGKAGLWGRRAHIAKTGNDFRTQNWIQFRVLTSTQ